MQKESTPIQTRRVVAVSMILIGSIWLLAQLGWTIPMERFIQSFWMIFRHLGKVIFTWPMILFIAGILMVTARRAGGWILVAIGGVFLIPKIFNISDFPFSMVWPVLMILAGGAMVVRHS